MEICRIGNHWYVPGWCYWENELSVEDGHIWVNVGFSTPLRCTPQTFQQTLAVSAFSYALKFN